MSGYAVTLVWRHAQAIGAARLVLLALAHVADDDGVATVPRPRLARMARIDERTVRRCLTDLVETGEITVERGANGPGSPTVYRIAVVQGGQDTPYTWLEGGQDAHYSGLHDVNQEPDAVEAGADDTGAVEVELPDDAMGSLPPDTVSAEPVAGGEASNMFAVTRRSEAEMERAARVTRPARQIPSHLPPNGLGAVLDALGVVPDHRGQLFWWRQEHGREFMDLLARLGVTTDALVERIREGGISRPNLARVSDIEGLV